MKKQGHSLLFFGTASLFYFYQFILRVSPGILVNDLMQEFHLGATEIGTLTALSMVTYSLLQVPAGIFADYFGVRSTILVFFSLCLVGLKLFFYAKTLFVAQLAKALIGAGSAAALLSVSKIIIDEFPKKNRATLLGIVLAVGTCGAMAGNSFLIQLLQWFNWRQSLDLIFNLGVVLLVLNFIFLKQEPQKRSFKDLTHQTRKKLNYLMTYARNLKFYENALPALSLYLPICILADLWGVTFLKETHGYSKEKSANILAIMYIGLCFGSLLLTSLSDWIKKQKLLILISNTLLIIHLALLIFLKSNSLLLVSTLLFLIGFFSGAEMLCFAQVSENSEKNFSGSITGLMNCVVMLGGAIMQEISGKLLDFFWDGHLNEQGIRSYQTTNFKITLSIMLISMIVFAYGTHFFIVFKKELRLARR